MRLETRLFRCGDSRLPTLLAADESGGLLCVSAREEGRRPGSGDAKLVRLAADDLERAHSPVRVERVPRVFAPCSPAHGGGGVFAELERIIRLTP